MAWVELSDSERNRQWDYIVREFSFSPSYGYRHGWPGIREPLGSKTWSIQNALDDPDPLMLETDRVFNAALHEALCSILAQNGSVIAMDWHHPCYKFYPHKHVGSTYSDSRGDGKVTWRVPILGVGIYTFFFEENLTFGTFGHPDNGTLCIWGQSLLDGIEGFIEQELGSPIRHNDGST